MKQYPIKESTVKFQVNLVLDVKLQKKIWKWENLEEGAMAQCYQDLTSVFLFVVSLLLLTNRTSRASICCASRARLPSSAQSAGRQGCGVIRRRVGCSGAQGGFTSALNQCCRSTGSLQVYNQYVTFSCPPSSFNL